MKSALKDLSVDYRFVNLRDLQIHTTIEQARKVQFLKIDGDHYRLGQRFWGSFCSRFQLGDTVFNYFSHDEVFERIARNRAGDSNVRICLVSDGGKLDAMALTNPAVPVVQPGDLQKLLIKGKSEKISYSDGSIRSTHLPRNSNDLDKLGDDSETFKRRFVMETPIDGYGKPKIFLELLRLTCQNGAIGMAPAFRTDIVIGKNPITVLERAIASFDNEDGFAAIKQRFEAAQNSPASIAECLKLYKRLERVGTEMDHFQVAKVFQQMTGNVSNMYGLANENILSDKKQRVLPSKCRVYDLINFASEVATHEAQTTFDADRLHAFIGDLVSSDYDLEETAKSRVKFQSRFLKAS